MGLFWEQGYDGTAIPSLTAAMGISPQSLYAAFGSKEALYREAIAFYGATVGGYVVDALAEGDAIRAVERLLVESAATFGRSRGTPGCMITTTPLAASDHPLAPLGRELRDTAVRLIEARLVEGMADGQVRGDAEPHAWACYIGSLIQGMSIQARDGASASDLAAVATIGARTLHGALAVAGGDTVSRSVDRI